MEWTNTYYYACPASWMPNGTGDSYMQSMVMLLPLVSVSEWKLPSL